jgi:hypothetical protein
MIVVLALVLPLLLYLPGLFISRAFPTLVSRDDWLACHYERVAIGTLLNGWLALLLAGVGIFSLWLHIALLLVLCGLLLPRSGLLPLTQNRHRKPAPLPPPTRDTAAFALVGFVALVLVVPPFETVLGVRDAGVYANAGFATARSGSLVHHDPLLQELGQAAQSDNPAIREPAKQALSNFLGVQHPERFIATRMRAAGFFINEGEMDEGRVVSQGFHLLPAWIGLLTSIGGFTGGLFAPGLMGLLGAWSVGMLGRHLAGGRVGVLAFLFLALNSVQVWFSRYSTSETTAQFLTFAGLYFFARFQQLPPDAPARSPRTFYAALAGAAIGQLVLTRIDFFLVVGPLLFYLLLCFVARRWTWGHTALALGLGAMLLHAALHITFIARAYFFDTAYARLQDYAITAHLALPFLTPLLREVYHTRTGSLLKDPLSVWRELALVASGLGGLLLLWRFPSPLHWIAGVFYRGRRVLLAISALAILLLSTYAYLLRPQIINSETLAAMPACLLSPQQWANPSAACLRLQGYIGAPIALPEPEPDTSADDLYTQDPRSYYATGWQALLSHMGRDHPRYDETVREGQRLLDQTERIAEHQKAGGAAGSEDALSELRREREATLARLDAITRPLLNMSFDTLCRLNIPTPKRDEKYVIPLANFVRVGWYLSPLGVALGVVGFALWWGRGFNRVSWLFLVVGLLGTFFYVRQTYGTSDQTYIYILRRFVSVSYPALSLGMAYVLGGAHPTRRLITHHTSLVTAMHRVVAVGRWLLVVFFVWTGRPIYQHTEYAGALDQLGTLAGQFQSDEVLLFRGGGPTYGQFRDVPDLVTTPLHFAFGLNTLTIKSKHPDAYAEMLAAQVRHWREDGRSVSLLLSASGGDVSLPGFALVRTGSFTLEVPEFEQLTNQKPHNATLLRLPFTIYRVQTEDDAEQSPTPAPLSLDATDFSAQVRGFSLPEWPEQPPASGLSPSSSLSSSPYAWTNGDALLRLPWSRTKIPEQMPLRLGGGERPPHLGPAQVCPSLVPDGPLTSPLTPTIALECITLDNANTMSTYQVAVPREALARLPGDRVLLRLESEVWVPAAEDPTRHDRRAVGVQFGGIGGKE